MHEQRVGIDMNYKAGRRDRASRSASRSRAIRMRVLSAAFSPDGKRIVTASWPWTSGGFCRNLARNMVDRDRVPSPSRRASRSHASLSTAATPRADMLATPVRACNSARASASCLFRPICG